MDQGPTRPPDDAPNREREPAPSEFDPAAWDWGRDYPPPRTSAPDLSGLFALLDVLRRAAPAELQERTTALVRELLLTLRSLIDWYLERLDQPPEKPTVEDIPID